MKLIYTGLQVVAQSVGTTPNKVDVTSSNPLPPFVWTYVNIYIYIYIYIHTGWLVPILCIKMHLVLFSYTFFVYHFFFNPRVSPADSILANLHLLYGDGQKICSKMKTNISFFQ
jgi:hypothetical protein